MTLKVSSMNMGSRYLVVAPGRNLDIIAKSFEAACLKAWPSGDFSLLRIGELNSRKTSWFQKTGSDAVCTVSLMELAGDDVR